MQVAGGWCSPFLVADLAIAGSDGQQVFRLESLRTSKGLLHLLAGRETHIIMSAPWADCSLSSSGQPKLTQALAVRICNPLRVVGMPGSHMLTAHGMQTGASCQRCAAAGDCAI